MILRVDEVVYQVVTPGEPEENGRCCLNGVGVDVGSVVIAGAAVFRVLVGGPGSETVGPLVSGRLELEVSRETRQREPRTHLGP